MIETWYDSEATAGVTDSDSRKHFFEVLNSELIRDYFKTDMPCPCDDCPIASECAESEAECSAFRQWCTKGKYTEAMIQKHLRVSA